jgi:hypothetical protein
MKGKTAKRLSREANPAGRFIPKGSGDDLRAFHRELPDLNCERVNRARAEGRPYVVLLGVEHVYRDPDTSQLVPASEAPPRAFLNQLPAEPPEGTVKPAVILLPLTFHAVKSLKEARVLEMP